MYKLNVNRSVFKKIRCSVMVKGNNHAKLLLINFYLPKMWNWLVGGWSCPVNIQPSSDFSFFEVFVIQMNRVYAYHSESYCIMRTYICMESFPGCLERMNCGLKHRWRFCEILKMWLSTIMEVLKGFFLFEIGFVIFFLNFSFLNWRNNFFFLFHNDEVWIGLVNTSLIKKKILKWIAWRILI